MATLPNRCSDMSARHGRDDQEINGDKSPRSSSPREETVNTPGHEADARPPWLHLSGVGQNVRPCLEATGCSRQTSDKPPRSRFRGNR